MLRKSFIKSAVAVFHLATTSKHAMSAYRAPIFIDIYGQVFAKVLS